ncbi:MAG: type I glyceraldehyde-3-phosphate dehydrogenase [Candidatus Eisenbacteria bacterium]|uniref:Glyceraldehyde-3-phosphate dehydrogenase n=1 Tax=Eiseniibacteriota bacterium TaxID=2212470 RepID=A0A937XAV8_UNCEI|nr:type I glyceraldehyde-3-phosphate dehydrogenase [Candidatus Eisenbacteria bacterium]
MSGQEVIRIGVNGFGRIGRTVFKQLLRRDDFQVAGINDLANLEDLAYLLKYDSVHGWYPPKVTTGAGSIQVDGRSIPFFSSADPGQIPWKVAGADIVIECSGALRGRAKAAGHLSAGAKRVIISAPSDDADAMIVLGVNERTYRPESHEIVSMASCTTNCLAPVAGVLHDSFGVQFLMFTTVHAYTSSQSLVDTPARHRRRGRAASLSIIPTTTGAAKAAERVLPQLKGKMTGMAMRVPVPNGSITDMVVSLERDATAEQINEALREAAGRPPLRGILRVTDEALVSQDIIGDPHSSIVDAQSTMVLNNRVAKVLAWYDNEWGYSARLVDFAAFMAGKGSSTAKG